MTTHVESYGDVVCDMHSGFPEDITVLEHIRLRIDNSHEALEAIWRGACMENFGGHQDKHLLNKYAYVVGYAGSSVLAYQAAYSYDNRYLGLFTFTIKE